MKSCLRSLAFIGVLWVLAGAASAQTGAETPQYSNVRVVSVDPARRVLVILNAKGGSETLVFDDLLGSVGAVKAGDHVIVTVRGGPGRRRLSAISVTSPPLALAPANTFPSDPTPLVGRREVRDRFARQVAVISEEARPVDAAWASFVTTCNVTLSESLGGGRDWFGLWEGRVQADYSGGHCRGMFDQIVSSGEGIKKAMAAAESVTKDALEPGEIRDIRRLHNMNWDGWTLPPPARRDR